MTVEYPCDHAPQQSCQGVYQPKRSKVRTNIKPSINQCRPGPLLHGELLLAGSNHRLKSCCGTERGEWLCRPFSGLQILEPFRAWDWTFPLDGLRWQSSDR